VHRLRSAVLLAALLGSACYRSGSSPELVKLEGRVAHLEEVLARREDALKLLEQDEARAAAEAQPQAGTVYGVDIQQNIALGQTLGSPAALVTIVEAWDFG
jgi:hypothetical protein